MMTKELMRELPSPNVTVSIPWAFDALRRVESAPHLMRYITCTVDRGVYIFDCESEPMRELIATAFDEAFDAHAKYMYPVDVTGFKNPQGRVGSNRFCTMSDTLASFFTAIIANSNMLDLLPSNPNAEFEQVSKYFRAMKYTEGGEHFPHYDSDFHIGSTGFSSIDTKMTLVAYGNDCETGEIAFIQPHANDGAGGEVRDWVRQATEDEIFLKVKPRVGRIAVFDHSLCHTVLPFTDAGGERRILRGDLIFQST
jgi:hypothetical protein